jgi:hypothetical protein
VLIGRKSGPRNTVSDVTLIDATGRVFAELAGMELHALPSGSFPRAEIRAEA